MKQRYDALPQPAADRSSNIEAALNARKEFEAGQDKVNKWIAETDGQLQEEPDLDSPLPKLNEIYIFYQGEH